jgi:hypothetical protein
VDHSLIFFLLAVLIAGVALLITLRLTKKRGTLFDKEAYQVDFLRIENALQQGNDASYAMVVIQGDKLLDKALCQMGVQGRTMGDRLKKIGDAKFSEINKVWNAHKLRNRIAHESDFQPDFKQAKNALATYKQALKDLGAI